LTSKISGVILEPSNSKGVSDMAERELISILQRGSWFKVTFLTGNRMEYFKAQGVAKTREAIQYYGVEHTPGNPYMATVGIDVKFFLGK
jgi:hypothetical protein